MKLSTAVRDGVRTELLDSVSLQHLEVCRAINWSSMVLWQCRRREAGEDQWMAANESICGHLEAGYCEGPAQLRNFMAGFTTFQVDYNTGRLLNTVSNELFDIRRLAMAPLMPMKVFACVLQSSSLLAAESPFLPLRQSMTATHSSMLPPLGSGVCMTAQPFFPRR